MNEHERHGIALKVGFQIIDKQYVLDYYLKKEDYYDHEMWLLYMGLVESYEFQRS